MHVRIFDADAFVLPLQEPRPAPGETYALRRERIGASRPAAAGAA